MIIKDRLLGNIEFDEPIIEEIINSSAMQRLKNISLGSYYPAFPDVAHKVSRYEHSVGVYILLKKFNASIEEQIAGLIHDVSHSAFSHTIDYIIKNENITAENQDYQDSIHKNFVINSEIFPILKKYNFDPDYILDNSNFKLLDNDYPNLCADRIDNGLRGAVNIDNYDFKNIKTILNGLCVKNNTFVFKDVNSAMLFYKLFEFGNEHYWSGDKSALMFSLNKRLFRYAIEQRYINFDDFYKYADNQIIAKLEKYKSDKTIQQLFSFLRQKNYKQFFNDKDAKSVDNINCKFRRVDPYIMQEGSLKRLSSINKKVKNDFERNTPQYLAYKVYYR